MIVALASSFTDHLTAWAGAAGALATFMAVLIALYRDTWRAARRRPRLSLSFVDYEAEARFGFRERHRGVLPGIR